MQYFMNVRTFEHIEYLRYFLQMFAKMAFWAFNIFICCPLYVNHLLHVSPAPVMVSEPSLKNIEAKYKIMSHSLSLPLYKGRLLQLVCVPL